MIKTKSDVIALGLVCALGMLLNPFQSALSATLTDSDLEAKLQRLQERADELDVQKSLNRVSISGTLINRYEMLDQTTGILGTDEPRNSIRAPITYLGLNFDANVSKNIKLYSTLAFSKFWQQENRWEPYGYWAASETGSFGLSGSTARFDRAYATYEFDHLPLTIAAGRMATNNGEPINQLDGFPRMGTYPRLAYNAIFDGIAGIYDFTKYLPKNNSFILRVFYTPYSNVSMTSRTTQMSDQDSLGNGYIIDSSTPEFAFLAEYNRKNLKLMEQIQFDLFIYDYWNWYGDGGSGSQQSSPILNGGTNPPGNAGYTTKARAESLFLGFENIGYFGLNFDISALFVTSTTDNPNFVSQSSAAMISLNEKFANYHKLVVGAEFIRTDPNYYLDEWSTLELMPFYSTANSKGIHLYASMPFSDHLVIRLGTYQMKTYPGYSSVSQYYLPNETNWHSVYTQARIDF